MPIKVPKLPDTISGLNETQRACFLGLYDESDRGCVIIGCAMIEAMLERLFESRFAPGVSNGAKKSVFENNGPLGTFSSRINLAYALGFISDELRNDLNAMRSIRNVSAHSYTETTFDQSDFESVAKGLRVGKQIADSLMASFEQAGDDDSSDDATVLISEARFRFMVNAAEIISRLRDDIYTHLGEQPPGAYSSGAADAPTGNAQK